MKLNILIIEDSHALAIALREVLEQQGHSVTWITGVKTLEPFVGSLQDESEVCLQEREFDLVIEDAELKGSAFQGEQIVAHMHHIHVTCVGNSTIAQMNEAMVEQGAVLAAAKPIFLAAVHAGALDLAALCLAVKHNRQAQCKRTATLMAGLEKTMRKDERYAKSWELMNARLMELITQGVKA